MLVYGKVVRCDNAECGLPVFRLKANRTLSDDESKTCSPTDTRNCSKDSRASRARVLMP